MVALLFNKFNCENKQQQQQNPVLFNLHNALSTGTNLYSSCCVVVSASLSIQKNGNYLDIVLFILCLPQHPIHTQ